MPSQSSDDLTQSPSADVSNNNTSRKSYHSPQEKTEILRDCLKKAKELGRHSFLNVLN